MLNHLQNNWHSYFASLTGSSVSFFAGHPMLESIIVGVATYIITHALSALSNILVKKLNK